MSRPVFEGLGHLEHLERNRAARDEVLDIFGGLADIHANTLEILRILGEEDDEEEDA
jgi:hypothetical protein